MSEIEYDWESQSIKAKERIQEDLDNPTDYGANYQAAVELARRGVVKTKKSDSKKKKGPIIEKASFIDDEKIYEQVYNGDTVLYAVWDNSEVKYVQSIMFEDITYKPILDDTLKTKAVYLPSNAEDYGSTKELLEEIQKFIKKYSDISPLMQRILSWYVLLTWIFDRLRTVPIARARGDTGTGKTRILDTVGSICYHSVKAAGCVTPAPIYRLIKKWNGTLILDEGDFRLSDEMSEVVKILNCGFQQGAPVIRCNKNDPEKLEILPTFGPKIIATRSDFKDKALESRCLTEIMTKTNRKDIPIDLPRSFFVEAEMLRNKLLMWRFKNYWKIDSDAGIDIDYGENIEPRIKQALVSFPPLFKNDAAALIDFKAFIQEHQRNIIEERSESFDGRIIYALAELLLDGIETNGYDDIVITAKDIAEKLSTDKKEYNPSTISRHLKNFRLQPEKPKKIRGRSVKRIPLTDREHLQTIFKGYLADDELLEKVSAVTVVTAVTGTSNLIIINIDPPESYCKLPVPYMAVTTETTVTEKEKTITEHPPIPKDEILI